MIASLALDAITWGFLLKTFAAGVTVGFVAAIAIILKCAK